jgi:hypothetical protein
MGARKVKLPKVAALAGAPSSMTRINRAFRSCASSERKVGPPVLFSCTGRAGIPRSMPIAAGKQSAATVQKAARHPSNAPSTDPPGTPAIVAIVVPDSSTASARPFLSGGTSVAAVEAGDLGAANDGAFGAGLGECGITGADFA